MTDRLLELSEAGVSIWLDDLSRDRIETGNLAELIDKSHVVGVTSNPSIFAAALAKGARYDHQIGELTRAGADLDTVVEELTTTDVRNACDIFRSAFEASGHIDGRVSIEVAPGLAHDTEATVAQAAALWAKVGRPNLMIKIPATVEGYPAIRDTLAAGIPVNVTLIFGLGQYAEVMKAFIEGIEGAHRNGHDLSKIHSVASFFVSRVDTEIDKRLTATGGHDELLGRAGVANARAAYEAFEKFFDTDRWRALAAAGATIQRPLWASTGVKNPAYRDTMYVDDLVVADTVNTMPEKTMRAFADHGDLRGDQVRPHLADARQVLDALAAAGVDYDDVISVLMREGVDKFLTAWSELLESVRTAMDAATSGAAQ